MAQLALVSDDLHFLQHLLPTWKQQFDLRVLNPPKPPPRIRGPRDLLAGLRNCRRWPSGLTSSSASGPPTTSSG